MLFDLQGRGRRNVVKVIYVCLALLMGGGLVLFGVGTGTGGGGLLDVFKGGGQSTKNVASSQEKAALKEVQANPSNVQAWADLTRARYQAAGQGANYDQTTGAFTSAGQQQLTSAASAWQRYLALKPKQPDPTLARFMANAYSDAGLNQPANAAEAMQIVTDQQPSAANYGILAQFAYLAHQTRLGDLAAGKAVALAPQEQRAAVKANLANAKKQAASGAAGQGASTTPTG